MSCCVATGEDYEEIDIASPDEVSKIDIPFHGVDYATWDPAVHDAIPTKEGKKNMAKIAKVLQENPDTHITIKGFTGPPVGPKMGQLAQMRSEVVRKYFADQGVRNQVSVSPIGFDTGMSKKFPRAEVHVVKPDDPPPRAAPAATAPFVTVDFIDEDKNRISKTWYDRPLGFTYPRGTAPVKVMKVVKGSRADIFGVKPGWDITHVEFLDFPKQDVEGKSFDDVHNTLEKGIRTLPHEEDRPWLALHFDDPDYPGNPKEKTFYTKPLGLTWKAGQSPIQIKEVAEGSRAWELGIRAGMTVRTVDFQGQGSPSDVNGRPYEEAYQLIQEGIGRLREAA